MKANTLVDVLVVDMQEIRDANARLGHCWFEPSTMRFFKSRVGRTAHRGPGGTFFVSSEQLELSNGLQPRRYTVRQARDNGDVVTVGPFNEMSKPNANAFALRCAIWGVPAKETASV